MKTNKEIVTEIINSMDLTFSTRKGTKITREKLIECWSEYRKEEYKFYGYTSSSGLNISYSKIFTSITKESKEPWKAYILRNNGYKIIGVGRDDDTNPHLNQLYDKSYVNNTTLREVCGVINECDL